ncbi:MAG: hypothetical protein LBP53_00250 [Candidatus Peribacteria bacterium]|jgi:hypothetical protein|nr:hypothetical protein [Candidatus Peribacteria bacterium]
MENLTEKLLGKDSLQNLGKSVSQFFSSLTEKKKESGSRTIIMTRQQAVTAVVVCILSFLVMLIYGYITYQDHLTINNTAPELVNLKQYDITFNEGTHDVVSIPELLNVQEETLAELEKNRETATEQGKYYNLFLRYLYLPSINIRKTPYTDNINPTLMGQKYLEKDPFQDIYLIQQWSDFFKNVGEGAEYNEVKSISIGDISDIDEEHFIIPLEVTFLSPDKRSFLLLVNKLSTTSSSNNISLLNEFFFYLIKQIKTDKKAEISQLQEQYTSLFTPEVLQNEDLLIGYHLYQWIKFGETNILIDDELIKATIRENTLCDNTRPDSECFYSFREKYRDLPYFAYTLGVPQETNKTVRFEKFLKELTPIISIKDFSFEKVKQADSLNTTTQYQGSVSFNVYGKNMSTEEVKEIASKLGTLCFGATETASEISPESALERVNANILQLGSNLQFSDIINDLEELNQLFSTTQTEYDALTNYKKTIKLFELFRMLKDANLCVI